MPISDDPLTYFYMKTRLLTLPGIIAIILLITTLPLRAEHYYYKQISLKEGLPSNVRCILRDEQGFIWIGTKAGLGKFDGHQLKRYKHQANDPHSLLHNLIYQIAEDTDRKRNCTLSATEQQLHFPYRRRRELHYCLFLLPRSGWNPVRWQRQNL